MKAHEILTQGASLVSGDREKQHGDKWRNLTNTAKLVQAYMEIRRDPRLPLNALDIAWVNVLQKIARTQSGEHNPDNYVDAAGYCGCAGEVGTILQGETQPVPSFLRGKDRPVVAPSQGAFVANTPRAARSLSDVAGISSDGD